MEFKLIAQDGEARLGTIKTKHGVIQTPVFMPVGTYGAVKSLSPDDLKKINFEIILGNTYHLWLRPGQEIIEAHKGLHKFINWNKTELYNHAKIKIGSIKTAIE